MAWIESHQELEEHPKMTLFMNKTGFNINEAVGLLHRLWWWTLKYAENGVLSKYESSQFLGRLTDKIDHKNLLDILIECKFIENNGEILKINDWFDYAGRYLTGKYRTSNPKKLREIMKVYKSVFRRTKVSPKSDNLPNLTYLTKPTKHKYGEFQNVLLSDEDMEKLKTRLGEEKTLYWIKQLDEGIELKGYKYKSHLIAITRWAAREDKEGVDINMDKLREIYNKGLNDKS